MTPRQRRFVEEYLVDLNAARAAKRAGYTLLSAKDHGASSSLQPRMTQ